MIKVRYCPKILSSDGQEVKEIPFEFGKTAVWYVDQAGFYSKDCRVIINGKVVNDLYIICQDDEISVAPYVGFDPVTWGTFWATVLNAILVAVISFAVSYGLNLLFARKPSRGGIGNGIDEGSSTYGWEGIRTTQEVGTPVPVVYGEHMVGGNIVNQHQQKSR